MVESIVFCVLGKVFQRTPVEKEYVHETDGGSYFGIQSNETRFKK